MPWGPRVVHVLDPDGNMLDLTKWLQGPSRDTRTVVWADLDRRRATNTSLGCEQGQKVLSMIMTAPAYDHA
jgi:hypothetical protein